MIIGCLTYQQDKILDLAMMVGVPDDLSSHKQTLPNPVQPKTKSKIAAKINTAFKTSAGKL